MKPHFFTAVLATALALCSSITANGQSKTLESKHFKANDGFVLPYIISTPASAQGITPASAQDITPASSQDITRFGSQDNNQAITTNGERLPLLVYLHGAGERGNDNISQLNHGKELFLNSPELENVIVIAPQCPSDGYWVDITRPTTPEECAIRTFPENAEMTAPLRAVKELIDSLINSGKVDTHRIYCTGLSMGGMGTLDLMLRFPDLFAAAEPICGAVNISRLAKYSGNTPVRLFHGDCDETVPVHFSREAYDTLKKIGHEVEYIEYPGVYHNSWDKAFAEKDFLKWMLCRRKVSSAAETTVTLSSEWKFRQKGMMEWHKATVPGTVHTDLMANGIIDDPYFGMNERDMQWIDKEDWDYETVFDLDGNIADKDNIELIFDGLDTYCDVYLNGTHILFADNMFRGWTVPCNGIIREKGNVLSVKFHSPIKIGLKEYDSYPYIYPASNDEPQSYHGGLFGKGVSVFTRKAGYHYGWDWGPRLVTYGIWRPVRLKGWNNIKINDIFYRQDNITSKKAEVTAVAEIYCDGPAEGVAINIDATFIGSCAEHIRNYADGTTKTVSRAVKTDKRTADESGTGCIRVASITRDLAPGLNTIEIPFSIKNPKLWWSNGLGDPNMYSFRISVSNAVPAASFPSKASTASQAASTTHNSETSDIQRIAATSKATAEVSKMAEVGLRDIRLVREYDEWGRSYRFELNGVPVFIKGANYIPCDMFLPRVSDEVYEKTVADAVAVGMNMLRIWGGGTYEDDRFYNLCDKNGILVWQDFMFACSLYPADDIFLKNVGNEAEYNIRRLRNHPCIALWCGNNECDSALYGWGWNERYKRSHPDWAVLIENQQERIYGEVLAGKVAQLDPHKSYVHGSPIADKAPVDPTIGDCHYWAVWNGGKSISEYNIHKSRFYSEWGFQSFPSIATINSFAPDSESHSLESDVFNWHQRGTNGNKWIMKGIRENYWEPRSFEDAVYLSQVTQAYAARTAVEAHRRYKPYCWGTIIWQHNDCWPVASWSTRDWYGGWKAAHYELKRVYRDILVSTVLTPAAISQDTTTGTSSSLTSTSADSKQAANDTQRWDNSSSPKANVAISIVSDRLRKTSGTLETVFMDVWGNVLRKESSKVSVPANSSAVYASYDNIPCGCIAYSTFTDGKEVYESIQPVPIIKDIDLPAATIKTKIVKTAEGFDVTLSSPCFAASLYLETDELGANFSDNFFDLLPGKSKTVSIVTDMPEDSFRKQLKIHHLQQTR